MRFVLIRLFLNALGLVVAAYLVDGISFDTPLSILATAVAAGLVNALVRPALFVLTLPLTVLTLGLFTLVLNALLLETVDWLVDGFHIKSFHAAFFAALIISLVSLVGSRFIAPRQQFSERQS